MIHEARSIQTKTTHIAKQHTKAHLPQSPSQ